MIGSRKLDLFRHLYKLRVASIDPLSTTTNIFSGPSQALSAVRWPIRTLGLDVNTNHTGYSLLSWDDPEESIRVNACGVVETKRSSTTVERAEGIRLTLLENNVVGDDLPKPLVCIEDYVKHFAGGRTASNTIFVLAELNTVVFYIMSRDVDASTQRVHPQRPRSMFSLTDKQDVYEALAPTIPSEVYTTAYRPRSGTFSDTNYDVTDAMLLALYRMKLEFDIFSLKCGSEGFLCFADSTKVRSKTFDDDADPLKSPNGPNWWKEEIQSFWSTNRDARKLLKSAPAECYEFAAFFRKWTNENSDRCRDVVWDRLTESRSRVAGDANTDDVNTLP